MAHVMRILFLLEDLCYGGTQRQMLELAARLDRSRFAPLMLTLTGPTDLDGLARQAGIAMEPGELHAQAMTWEIRHSGRTPRVARQFIASLHA